MPDRRRAETYLRLQAEAELRRALAMPDYKPPREHRTSSLVSYAAHARRMRRRRAIVDRIMRQHARAPAQAGRQVTRGPADQPERQARSLLAALQRSATSSLTLARSAASPLAPWLHQFWRHAAYRRDQIRRSAWHLRRRVRRRLPQRFRGRSHEPSPAEACAERVGALASVLAAVGAISTQTEAEVVADFAFALAARSRLEPDALLGDFGFSSHRLAGRGRPHPAPGAPPVARPVGLAAAGEVEGVRVRFYLGVLVFDQGSVTLTMQARFPPEAFEHDHYTDPMFHALSEVRAIDDRGGTYQAHFSGGGGAGTWEGRLHLIPPPAAGLRWLDVTLPGASAVRVRMDTPPADLRVTAEPVTMTAAERLIDAQAAGLLLASTTDAAQLLSGEDTPNVARIAADLLAAGVITTSSKSLRRLAGAAARFGVRLPGSLAAIQPADLPADWLSLRARAGRTGGPTGVIPVGAVLPEVDGARCVIGDLSSDADSATVQVHARGWPEFWHEGGLRIEQFRWTARDDLGGWYVLDHSGGSYSDDEADLDFRFSPALDSRARLLDIILTGTTTQVSVTVPLDWREGA